MAKRKTAAEIVIEKLIDEGWRISHTATVYRYLPAGTVSSMTTRNGRQYCRVHEGRNVGKHNYQITTVMYKEIKNHESI